MKGVGLLTLLGFVAFNMVQRTSFRLNDFQQSVLMVIGFVGIVVAMEKLFPLPPSTPTKWKTITKIQYVEIESKPSIPDYGTPTEQDNHHDAGMPEHGKYGV